MKKYLLAFMVFAVIGSLEAQKTINDPNAETRNISSFHAIQISSGIDLYLSQGNETVAVSASDEETRNKIITKVDDGILKIYLIHNLTLRPGGDKKMKTYVSFKTLNAIDASGGSDVYANDGITEDKFSLHASGGSDFHGKISCNDVDMQASGGSDIYVSGKTVIFSIQVSGGSDCHGYDLITDNCTIDANGGSDVYITSAKELNVSARGGSDERYKGTGIIKKMNTRGRQV